MIGHHRAGRFATTGALLTALTLLTGPVRCLADNGNEVSDAFHQARAGTLEVGLVLNTRIGTTITPVRFEPKSGLSQAYNEYWCGVMLVEPNVPAQAIITIGLGENEALSCGTLLAAGVVVPRDSAPELALIYDATSPNVDNQVPVLLARDPHGIWKIDERRSDALADSIDTLTIAAIRNALAKGGNE